MIKSMTGYGKAERVVGAKKITVEIRSLNSKQLDLSFRMPSVYRSQDAELRALVSKSMRRGKVDVFVNVETDGGEREVAIDEQLFSSYYNKLSSLANANSMGWGNDYMNAAAMQSILRLPNVAAISTEEANEDEIEGLKMVFDEALGNIDRFRVNEGAILIADILERIEKIKQLLGEVEPYEKQRAEKIKERIRENIESAEIPFDANRLEQEMIYYIEKLDVTEEKVRLANHCNYFGEVVNAEDAPGRKLGFISQEIGREINTLGSKANDASIQHIVVGMKDELEKIKEQLLNIL